MRRLKKLFSAMLIVSIILSCFASGVYADAGENIIPVRSYDELKSAFETTEDYTILLENDITIENSIVMSGKCAVVLDLNGHTLTFNPSSASTSYAIQIKSEYNYYIKNELSTGGLVNLSDGMNFFNAGNRSLYVSGTVNGEITCNSTVYLDDCVITGKVIANSVYLTAGKNASIGGTLLCGDRLEMKDAQSKLNVSGDVTVNRRATIYDGAVFGGSVNIAKNFTYNSGDGSVTNIYGGTFYGNLVIADNVTLKYATSTYRINIYGGKYYNKVTMANANPSNIGKMSVTINKGDFYKNAQIISENITINGGNFAYTFTDENGEELKSVLARYNAKIIAPTVPRKQGYTFKGWSGFNDNMTVKSVNTFKAEYVPGEDLNDDVYKTVDTPVGYTKGGVAIEGVTDIYNEVAYPNITYAHNNGTESATTGIYGLSEYIPAVNGDVFRVSAVKTNVYNGEDFAAAYDVNKNFLGVFVHNDHKKMEFIGRSYGGPNNQNTRRYSIGLPSEKTYYRDVEFQVPASDEGSLFEKIAYIRFKVYKSTALNEYILDDNDFYVGYVGNKDAFLTTSINYLNDSEDLRFNNPLSSKIGDLDNDSNANIADILYLKKCLANYKGYTAGLCNADLNFDGKIDIKDIVYLMRHAAGWDGYELETPKFIALSFDDAPGSMASVLTVFENYRAQNVRASYMLNGSRVNRDNYHLLQRAVNLGIHLGNHSTYHASGVSGSKSEIMNEVNFTQDVIYDATKRKNSYFRAPFFTVTARMKEALSDMVFIEGTSSSDTSNNVTAEKSAQTQLNQAKHGNIILLHDNNKLVDTLNILIPALLEDGYKLVSIEEIFKYCNVTPKPGYIYTNVFNPRAA